MFKKIVCTLVLVALAGCGAGFNKANCRQAVVDEFGTSDVVNISDSSYKFIVRAKDGSVWYVETMNASDVKITARTKLFEGKAG